LILLGVLASSLTIFVGCGDDGSDVRPTGQGGASATGGGSFGGSVPTLGGNTAKGGTSGIGGSNGIGGSSFDPLSTVGHCGPTNLGVILGATCFNYDTSSGGILPGTDTMGVASWQPLAAIVAGKRYALSFGIAAGPLTVEFWGATSQCGGGMKKLVEVVAGATGVHCLSFTAEEAYSDLLSVLRDGNSGVVGIHLCADGTCP
jgi:hypothetical protein